MIYLSSPYTGTPEDMQERYEAAMHCTAHLLRHRMWTYSPIVHCHELACKHTVSRDFFYWQDYNFHMLSLASDFFILCIPGWDKSKGVRSEAIFARGKQIPCRFIRRRDDEYIIGVVSPEAEEQQYMGLRKGARPRKVI